MNTKLAEKILSKRMGWLDEEVNDNISPLLYMTRAKYDGYDRFMPGTRFLGSLSVWLNLFKDDERKVMLRFLRERVLFISSNQISYLIQLLYSTCIKQNWLDAVCTANNIPAYMVNKAAKSADFTSVKRKSLFVGLSDGAHMDAIRRDHGLNNDQVLTNYYPSADKLNEMLGDLREELKEEKDALFEDVYLIDDFTASGKSFIREEDGVFKGKLPKIFDSIFVEHKDTEGKVIPSLKSICSKNVRVHIYFCIATEDAIKYISDELDKFLDKTGLNKELADQPDKLFTVEGLDWNDPLNQEVAKIISNPDYLNRAGVITKHYEKGRCDEPWKGFNECSLAIVLNHNTPNNSLPILWQPNELNYPSLFTRISRH